MKLHLDYETRSTVDLKTKGLVAYASHPSTGVLLAAYSIDDGPVKLWRPPFDLAMPDDLRVALQTGESWAWNAGFEREITTRVLGVHGCTWRDTMAMALYASLPADLASAGAALGLSADHLKDPAGKRLIRRFSIPQRDGRFIEPSDDLESFEEFGRYCVRDVESEMEIHRLVSRLGFPNWLWTLWETDQRINARGVPVDGEFVRQAIDMAERERARLVRQLCTMTGLHNPMGQCDFLAWAQANGYPFGDLRKATVAKALASPELADRPVLASALRLRGEAGKTSLAKYGVIGELTHNGRIYNTMQFYGAPRTGRWSGRQPQPHNFPRPHHSVEGQEERVTDLVRAGEYDDLLVEFGGITTPLSSVLRSSFRAKPGCSFVMADLNAIENRVLGWLARCDPILDVFRQGRCPYLSFAAFMYGQSYEELEHEFKVRKEKQKRTNAKPAVLGCFAADTEVLTWRGWLPISQVRIYDVVYDGSSWVAHDGVAYRGVKRVIDLCGVLCTPDHLILAEDNWHEAATLVNSPKLLQSALNLLRHLADCGPSFGPREKITAREPAEESTYDILNAGPNNRFVIRTDRGPLIVHNCGYMLSGGELITNEVGDEVRTGLWGYAEAMGIKMTREQSHDAVRIFREAYLEVVQFWYDMKDAAFKAVSEHLTVKVGFLTFEGRRGLLSIRLPSGRRLNYLQPRIETVKRTFQRTGPDGKPYTETRMMETLTYAGQATGSRAWVRVQTHPGKLAENVTQAVAADVLACGIMAAEADGFPIVLHVHDEIVAEVWDHDTDHTPERLCEVMSRVPKWAPGLPLAAAGERTKFYKK